MDGIDWVVVGFAGFFGGMLNSVAGGGSFITLPALIFVGVPPVAANATGTAALLPGYIASAWRFRNDIEFPANLSFKLIAFIAILGGCIGAVILMLTSNKLFSTLIPWLIILATIALIIGPLFLKRKDKEAEYPHLGAPIIVVILLAVCIYGGYFNGGLGIILLATFALMGQTNIHGMNGLKNIISALLTVVAVIVYAIGSAISGEYLLFVGAMAILGGYVGAAFAYRISQKALRVFIVFVGCLTSIGFFLGKV